MDRGETMMSSVYHVFAKHMKPAIWNKYEGLLQRFLCLHHYSACLHTTCSMLKITGKI